MKRAGFSVNKPGLAYLFIAGLICFLAASCTRETDPVNYIDPFIGTGGHGHTYPGPSMPFGMVQLSPDTRLDGWDGCSGYHYSDDFVYGFSHTHLSGTGASDYGDILLMPTTGIVMLEPGNRDNPESGYASVFSHSREKAKPGYYSVKLLDDKIFAELTCTERVGFHSYRFPKSSSANIIIDLQHRDKVLSSFLRVVNEYELEGLRRSQQWAADQYVYFVIRFSKPFRDYGLYINDQIQPGQEVHGQAIKGHVSFKTKRREKILVKVGISAVSVEGARRNLEAELPDWDFKKTTAKAENAWRDVANRITVKGGTKEQKKAFYTSLYHQYLSPNLYIDVDGLYRGRDLLAHKAEDFTNYTVFSLWDTFRATHPLFTILETSKTQDFIRTFLKQYEQGGLLPVWELSANETGTMIGYHSVSVIADAFNKGLRDYDTGQALTAMLRSAGQNHLGLAYYRELGYVPASEEDASVSKTLEYAYDDWCISTVASEMGYDSLYIEFIQRAQNYKNVFDPSTGFMRAKMGAQWFEPFDPREVNYNYTEANAWQYSFFVPQDISGMIELYGGAEAFSAKLDELFTTSSETTGRDQADITGMIGQYAHGNEPSHHIAYLYSYAGKPWKTQEYVSRICREMYSDEPDGLCGNEDCGQMSAWYIFSALGFYPVCPGLPQYVFGTPMFDEAVIRLENGNIFTIKAENNLPGNIYIQRASLNGKDYAKAFIDHETIIQGGEIVFHMGPEPAYDWGTGDNKPVTKIDEHLILPVPFVSAGNKTFATDTSVELSCLDTAAQLFYQVSAINSSGFGNYNEYSRPINLSNSRTISFFAQKDLNVTPVMEADFYKLPENRKITLHTPYSNQYSGGGDNTLIDMIRGNRNFRTGAWQGYEGVDIEAVVDLGSVRSIGRLELSCFQDQDYWIFMPLYVEYETSVDGTEWKHFARAENDLSEKASGSFIKTFLAEAWTSARYVKVKAKNMGVCPDWHKGAGLKAWIFADEFIIE